MGDRSGIGIHSALWVEEWGEDLSPHIEAAARLGYDCVEVSLLGLQLGDATRLRTTAADQGVKLLCTTGLSVELDITSPDQAVRRSGVDYLARSADLVAELGAGILTGVIYAPWGVFFSPSSRADRRRRSADALAQVAPQYAERGISLGIEAVNRFESDLVNTARDALDLVEMIGQPNVGVHLDAFHMNIEERNIRSAILATQSRLVHVLVAGTDRGVPQDHRFEWTEFFRALREIDYHGGVGVEMFVQSGQPVSSDLRIWRPIESSLEGAAVAARQFVSRYVDQEVSENDNGK
jgi:D-psicose/D-tagatose/L-ribulose 3-epimerase